MSTFSIRSANPSGSSSPLTPSTSLSCCRYIMTPPSPRPPHTHTYPSSPLVEHSYRRLLGTKVFYRLFLRSQCGCGCHRCQLSCRRDRKGKEPRLQTSSNTSRGNMRSPLSLDGRTHIHKHTRARTHTNAAVSAGLWPFFRRSEVFSIH